MTYSAPQAEFVHIVVRAIVDGVDLVIWIDLLIVTENMDLDDEYKPMYDLYYFDWRNAIENEYVGTAEMPKEAAVSADIKNQATQQAKAKFGAKFVKAIVVESDWHVYTDPNNFNRTDHRSINVDVITKDGDHYYVSHQLLWQNYKAGSWGSYDMRQKSFGQQKVNYK